MQEQKAIRLSDTLKVKETAGGEFRACRASIRLL